MTANAAAPVAASFSKLGEHAAFRHGHGLVLRDDRLVQAHPATLIGNALAQLVQKDAGVAPLELGDAGLDNALERGGWGDRATAAASLM